MTSQQPDLVLYKRRKYELVGGDGDGLFDPKHHNLAFQGMTTSNYRGYVATYAVKGGELLLRAVSGGGFFIEPPPRIAGHLPTKAELGSIRGWLEYTKLELPMAYTGRLVLGGGAFLAKPGFFPDPSIYELVHELRFEEGHLVEAKDLSAEASQDPSLKFAEEHFPEEIVEVARQMVDLPPAANVRRTRPIDPTP